MATSSRFETSRYETRESRRYESVGTVYGNSTGRKSVYTDEEINEMEDEARRIAEEEGGSWDECLLAAAAILSRR